METLRTCCMCVIFTVCLTNTVCGQGEDRVRVVVRAREIEQAFQRRGNVANNDLDEPALVYLANSKVDPSVKFNALLALGNHDGTKTLDTLVTAITYYRPTKSRTLSPITGFPAARALVRIGGRARDTIIEAIGTDYCDYELEIIAHILLEIDGDPRVAAFRLTLEMERVLRTEPKPESREAQRKNLRKVISFLNEENIKMKRLPDPPKDLEQRREERDGLQLLPQ